MRALDRQSDKKVCARTGFRVCQTADGQQPQQ